ncbi:globin domain-containing protein [Jannaschia sp. M317]|uniref:globin domain-containing protein n=1 Tax=Jannaschia sp. M317 TaxID=2867011 RepID=UPI0021A3194A|nr:globin domain-containing protein [Jannaschia sp. M317]UWQ17437.1 hemin receptor [Jannaschia sp. M317]
MTDGQGQVLLRTLGPLSRHATRVAQDFYLRLFAAHPEVRSLFPRDMADQERKLMDTLLVLVSSAMDARKLDGVLRDLARRHVSFGAQADHYPIVTRLLLDTLEDWDSGAFTGAELSAWSTLLSHVASVMMDETRTVTA